MPIFDKLISRLTIITLVFFKVVFSGGGQEELIQCQDKFIQLLNNLFKVG